MPIVYLTPEDLTVSQTNQVLDFLNSAQTAEEIATRIAIPNELDVGLKVGQHILNHRAQLPNGFTNLQQLMDVYHVGPERFTEIVAVITGIPLPQFTPASIEELVRRTLANQLRSQARTALPVSPDLYRISVQPPADTPWLGQEVTFTVKVFSTTTRKSVPNLAVTFESSNMQLSTQFGYEIRQGQVVSSRTATDGSIRLRLRNLFDESLTADQYSALTDALRHLRTGIPAPKDMMEDWHWLTGQYEDVRNKRLRSAIDIVYRSASKRLTNTINQQDHLYQWRFHSGLLRIYVDTETGALAQPAQVADATAAQVGVYHVAWREWLLPWYQVYLDQLSGRGLQQTFVEAKERTQSEAAITAEILGHAYRFVAEQNGILGEALSQQVMGKEIQRFLAREISSFSPETQTSMFPSLLLAGNTISRNDTGTLALVNQTRADVEMIIDERIGRDGINVDEIFGSLSRLNGRLEQLDSRVTRNDGRFNELQLEVSDMRGDMEGINGTLVNVQGAVVQINTELQRIDSNVLQLDANFQQVDTDIAQLETNFQQLNNDVRRIDTSVNQLDTNVNQLDTQVNQIDTQVNQLDTRIGTINEEVGTINSQVGTINNQVGTLSNQVTGIDQNVNSLSTSFSGLDTEVKSLNRNVVLKDDITRDANGKLVDIKTVRTPRG